ncbi:hypothetical protein ACFW9O_19095 [Streptomyces sp. NPDC059499]|uniref:hypothetical protein n=1 Tax=Streptomyces sp. NPDC059499 TaxID=3346852 RepID=UPI003685CFC9
MTTPRNTTEMANFGRDHLVSTPSLTSSDEPASGYQIRRIQRPAAVIAAGGVFLPAEVCHPLWLALRAHLARHRTDGGQVRPEVVAALDALRAAGLDYLTTSSPNGLSERTPADIGALSSRGLVTTEELAGRLGVTGRHVRRLAAQHGVTAAARGLWHHDDAEHLTRQRKDR